MVIWFSCAIDSSEMVSSKYIERIALTSCDEGSVEMDGRTVVAVTMELSRDYSKLTAIWPRASGEMRMYKICSRMLTEMRTIVNMRAEIFRKPRSDEYGRSHLVGGMRQHRLWRFVKNELATI
jgi:hypothetical protein